MPLNHYYCGDLFYRFKNQKVNQECGVNINFITEKTKGKIRQK